jgi:hypothetical protein
VRQFLQYTLHPVLVIFLLITQVILVFHESWAIQVTITFVGFSDFVNPDVFLQLEKTKTPKLFYLRVHQLQEVVVKASKNNTFNSKELGANNNQLRSN